MKLTQLLPSRRPHNPHGFRLSLWEKLHLDLPLLLGLTLLISLGMLILYSAGGKSLVFLSQQAMRLGLAASIMIVLAQIPPQHYRTWAPRLYILGVILLIAVLALGVIGKGAQRWLNLGLFRFQPSELLKLALPMVLAWYFADRPLPPKLSQVALAALLILIPAALVAKQPDLGTAILIAGAGFCVLLLAGLSWRLLAASAVALIAIAPLAWHFLKEYQRQRVLTFLDPERDPLGSGYHIIQSKIAIGSGGLFGKGWLQGTQSHLNFLPEHATDFIFAVCGEEFGLMGAIVLLSIYAFIVIRCLQIAMRAQDTFSRLLAGSLALSFFLYIFINIGMVSGLLPVVGVPLPLVSYGGTSMVTLMASFGILMSIQTHRRLVSA
jgi:rod shape determining protein RodA